MKSLLLLSLMSTPIHAVGYLDINIGSQHTSERCCGKEYNEDNRGIGYSTDNWTIGTFKNSYYKDSVYAGGVWGYNYNKYINYGFILGGVTGYQEVSGYKVMPLALPYVTIGNKDVRLKVSVIPAVIGFTLQVRL